MTRLFEFHKIHQQTGLVWRFSLILLTWWLGVNMWFDIIQSPQTAKNGFNRQMLNPSQLSQIKIVTKTNFSFPSCTDRPLSPVGWLSLRRLDIHLVNISVSLALANCLPSPLCLQMSRWYEGLKATVQTGTNDITDCGVIWQKAMAK